MVGLEKLVPILVYVGNAELGRHLLGVGFPHGMNGGQLAAGGFGVARKVGPDGDLSQADDADTNGFGYFHGGIISEPRGFRCQIKSSGQN